MCAPAPTRQEHDGLLRDGSNCDLLRKALPAAERRRVLTHSTLVALPFGKVLVEAGARFRYVYFPTTATISLISSVGGRARLEVGLIGSEGLLGILLLTGVDKATLRALVQGPGSAWRMKARVFARILKRSPFFKPA